MCASYDYTIYSYVQDAIRDEVQFKESSKTYIFLGAKGCMAQLIIVI